MCLDADVVVEGHAGDWLALVGGIGHWMLLSRRF